MREANVTEAAAHFSKILCLNLFQSSDTASCPKENFKDPILVEKYSNVPLRRLYVSEPLNAF
jgi:hypothetical protein